MKINGTGDDCQHPSICFKQGRPLSTTWLGLLTDGLHQFLAVHDAGVRLQDQILQLIHFKYANDICLLATSSEQLQALLDPLLKSNSGKPCILILCWNA